MKTKEEVLKAINNNKIKNKELSNKVAKAAFLEILKEEPELKNKLDKKEQNNKEVVTNE